MSNKLHERVLNKVNSDLEENRVYTADWVFLYVFRKNPLTVN